MKFRNHVLMACLAVLSVGAWGQSTQAVGALIYSGTTWGPWTQAAAYGALGTTPQPVRLFCQASANAAWTPCTSGGGGSGTVTTFSSTATVGTLFTTTVANPTTTPAQTITLANAPANSVWGNFTGSTGAPGYSAAPVFSAANLTNFPTLNQSTTGNAATATTATNLSGGSVAATTLSASSTVSGAGFTAYLAGANTLGSSSNTTTIFSNLITGVAGSNVTINAPTGLSTAFEVNGTLIAYFQSSGLIMNGHPITSATTGGFSSTVTASGFIATAAAPTVSASQVGFGGTVSASSSCGTLASAAGCLVINVAGTTHYVPYY